MSASNLSSPVCLIAQEPRECMQLCREKFAASNIPNKNSEHVYRGYELTEDLIHEIHEIVAERSNRRLHCVWEI
jgi:hypothetical protein